MKRVIVLYTRYIHIQTYRSAHMNYIINLSQPPLIETIPNNCRKNQETNSKIKMTYPAAKSPKMTKDVKNDLR